MRTRWRELDHWIRRLVVIGVSLLVVALISTIAIGYYYSQQLLNPDIPPLDYDVEVLEAVPASAAAPRTITLERTEETLRDGVFGLDTDSGGHAILGRIVSSDADGVTRRVREVLFVSRFGAFGVDGAPVACNRPPSLSAASAAPGLVVLDDPENALNPLATDASGRDEVFVGRLRRDPSHERGLCMWIVSDLRKERGAQRDPDL